MLLRMWGQNAAGAATVAEAISAAAALPPDVLLVDYRLRNDETGVMVIEAVRRRAGTAVPAVVLTGDTAPEPLKDLAERGIPVLHKPVIPQQIRSLVATLCRRPACHA